MMLSKFSQLSALFKVSSGAVLVTLALVSTPAAALSNELSLTCVLDNSGGVKVVADSVVQLISQDMRAYDLLPDFSLPETESCKVSNQVPAKLDSHFFNTIRSHLSIRSQQTRFEQISCRTGEVQTSAAVWLLGSAIIGFVGLSNKRKV